MMKTKWCIVMLIVSMGVVLVCGASEVSTEGKLRPRLSPDEVENQITLDQKANPLYESRLLSPVREWRDGFAEKTGLHLGLDYSALYMHVSDSPGEDKASGGIARFYGYWDLVNRGGPNKGSLNWKIENRHAYSDIAPSALGFESGYAGIIEPPFSDQKARLTNLYWKQYVSEGKGVFVGGFLDTTDFIDVYLLSSPWTGFANFVFSTGSASMDLPNDATLGAAAGAMVNSSLYVQAGIADANSDPRDPFQGFESVIDDSDFFKWVEIGLTPGKDKIYFDNTHVTFWQVDKRANGTDDGWGVNLSWQRWIDDTWLPFIRGGVTDDSGSLLEKSVSAGVGCQPVPMRGVIGFGFNWGRPNGASFEGADDQYTAEVFWRYQLTKELAVTPSVQYIKDPALNTDEDNLWVVGCRLRVAL
ncbi:carbohydrate porin [Desulfoluna spongiiphila]|uniref:Porin n=1 Tax=Desulfoluna spongiiphila TaxID=419481 RepID=A0A1G5J0Q1_9BACT|nr:carbohydrate porin [Desulfoluna spongiiphila]SCY81268.1 porin [Desulfoluna spongiiphila]